MTAVRAVVTFVTLATVPVVAASSTAERGREAVAGTEASAPGPPQAANATYDSRYQFTRIRYGASRGGFGGFRRRGGGAMWAHDYPRAERNFLRILAEMTFVDAETEASNIVGLDEDALFENPIAYIVEVGFWNPTDEEAARLGEYLLKGGFLIVDDFRGRRELDNLEFHMSRVLPGHNMVQVDATEEIFDAFFRVVPEDVTPPYGGQVPIYYGYFEDNDRSKRLMVIINANNDIAEYWEFSDFGYYLVDLSNEAYKLGVNYVVYGHTH